MVARTTSAPLKSKIFHLVTIVFSLFVFASTCFAGDEECPLFGAEYVPQNLHLSETYDENKNDINRTLSFVLRIEKGEECCHSNLRNVFLNFDAYNKEGSRVSTMRFGDVWSNGVSRQSFSTNFGMYCHFGNDDESDCEDMKLAASFVPIGVNKDLSGASIRTTPFLLIFPGTYWELRYKSYQRPEHWDQYIKFYTEDRIYPDFRGYDFWIRKKCGKDNL